MNKWTGLGRLVRDPDVDFTKTGKCVTRFIIACNSKKNDKQYVEFIPCEAWNKTAETIGEYCGKGDQVLIEGRFRIRPYEKDGVKRYYSYISVSRMEFGSKRNTQKATPDSERQPIPEVQDADYQKHIFGDSPITEDDVPF